MRAIYPGSFDPVTLGHMDIIKRALKFIDELVVGVGVSADKSYLFSQEERISLIRKSIKEILPEVYRDRVKVDLISGLMVDYMKQINARIIIRGIRVFSDFDYEFNLAGINAKLSADVETVFLTTSESKQFISSRFVKEIAKYKGNLSEFVAPCVIEAFNNKYSK